MNMDLGLLYLCLAVFAAASAVASAADATLPRRLDQDLSRSSNDLREGQSIRILLAGGGRPTSLWWNLKEVGLAGMMQHAEPGFIHDDG